ncbi:MAG: hypothetical protein EKK64_04355 [Neisseriaceae bacterium]|nr:MAG: hypothetical protein EKK64_04355 [Neisseriaceae bacterium]
MERTSIIEGNIPILLIAPHGHPKDDERTALITEFIANKINAYAVINRGWRRSEEVDFLKDKADCNNLLHCQQDVVREEILDPILRYKNKILKKHAEMYIFHIHGMSDKHRDICGDYTLDLVIGYGAGNPNRFTCDAWRKDLFIKYLEAEKITTYEGGRTSQMSGWSNQNMNQLFRFAFFDEKVQSMQIEIINELRRDNDIAMITADYLADCMMNLMTSPETKTTSKNKIY